MVVRNIIVLFIWLFFNIQIFSQTIVQPGLVKWLTIEQADSLFDKNPKPMLIDVYTDWCGWCKYMMKTTFANKDIAGYINQNFYPVRFNAETFDTIVYQGKTYTNHGIGTKPKHDFAKYLLNGRFSFPTIVYSDRKRNLYQIPGYMKVKDIEPLLVYFAEDINIGAKYDDWKFLFQINYSKKHEKELADANKTNMPDTNGVVHNLTVKEASDLTFKNKKPLLIYFYTDWCQSCKIEMETVFRNKIISDLLNEKYNFVMFNAASENPDTLFGDILKSTGKGRPHQLMYALLKQSFKFPAFVFINSEKQKLSEMHGFLLPYQLEQVLSYFADETYKNIKFDDYLKTFSGKIK